MCMDALIATVASSTCKMMTLPRRENAVHIQPANKWDGAELLILYKETESTSAQLLPAHLFKLTQISACIAGKLREVGGLFNFPDGVQSNQ